MQSLLTEEKNKPRVSLGGRGSLSFELHRPVKMKPCRQRISENLDEATFEQMEVERVPGAFCLERIEQQHDCIGHVQWPLRAAVPELAVLQLLSIARLAA